MITALALTSISGCAGRSAFVRPTGPAVPMPDAEGAALWAEATGPCADVRVFNAELRPAGRLAGERIRGVTLFVAVTAAGDLGIEAVALNQTQFTIKGTADRATLVLARENRVVSGPAADILNALVGLDVHPRRLLALLSGCLAVDRQVQRVVRIGELVRVTTADSVVFLARATRESGMWRPMAAEFGDLLVDYREIGPTGPHVIGVRTQEGRVPSVDISITVRDARINPEIEPAAFTIVVPPGAVPAAVSDLRLIGSDQ